MGALIHDPLTRFIAQVLLIVLVSRLLGLVARRIGQPMVIAEVVAGILLGPSLLGWLAPDAYHTLFEPNSMKVLHMVSQLGLILFMFLVGLELDPTLLRGRGRTSVVISHTSIVAPFAMGMGLAVYLRDKLAEPGVSFTSFALFLGAAMSITAFPVLARILTERRLLRTKVGAVTIACAAVDDVTAWCILAFVVASARSTGMAGAVRTTILAVVYIGAMVWLVRPFLGRLAGRIANREGLTQNIVAIVILLLLASSWATELIGIHALFGAFLFGAVLPKEGGFARALADKLEDVVVVIVLPLFFAYSGVRTQIGLLDTGWAWAMCGLVIFVACAGKFLASTLAARLTGLGWREAGAIGVLMNTRGLMELIVINIGLDLGVIGPTLFAMLVVMALVTTFLTTPLLQKIYPPELASRDLLVSPEPRPAPPEPVTVDEPVVEASGFTILLCIAYTGSGPGMVTIARTLQKRGHVSRTYALHLVPPSERGSFIIDRGAEHQSASTMDPLLEQASSMDLTVRPLSFVSSDPGADICRVAEAKKADLIMLGWHKPLLSQTRLGGTVYQVMKDAVCDATVFIDRGLARVKRVLVPFLGSPHDRAALSLANRIMENGGGQVTILHVIEPGRTQRGEVFGAREEAAQVFDEVGGGRVELKVVEHTAPAEAALEESSKGYDLVIVGIGREWGLEERPFGYQPELLMDACPVSLMVVHRGPIRA